MKLHALCNTNRVMIRESVVSSSFILFWTHIHFRIVNHHDDLAFAIAHPARDSLAL